MLLNLGEAGGFNITPWTDPVQMIDATFAGRCDVPVLGEVTAPAAVLIRPDGPGAWWETAATWGLLTRSPPVRAGVVGPCLIMVSSRRTPPPDPPAGSGPKLA